MQPLFASDFSGIGEAFLAIIGVGVLFVAAVSLPIAALIGRRYGKRIGLLTYPGICVAMALVVVVVLAVIRAAMVASSH